MLYLLLAVASSAAVSIIMRLSEKRAGGNTGMLAVNYVMCAVLAAVYTFGSGQPLPRAGLAFTAGMGAFNGLLYLLGFVLLQLNVNKNGVVLSATFMKLGLLVPIALSALLFREYPGVVQGIGFALAIAAIVIINAEKEATVVQFKAGLVLLLLAGGGGDAMSKVFEEWGPAGMGEAFLLFTFGTALVLCFGLMLRRKEKFTLPALLYGLALGIPNYFSARFLLKALGQLPAVVAYPTYSVAGILAVTLAGVLFFKEKLGRRHWLAMGIILPALVLLNI